MEPSHKLLLLPPQTMLKTDTAFDKSKILPFATTWMFDTYDFALYFPSLTESADGFPFISKKTIRKTLRDVVE